MVQIEEISNAIDGIRNYNLYVCSFDDGFSFDVSRTALFNLLDTSLWRKWNKMLLTRFETAAFADGFMLSSYKK